MEEPAAAIKVEGGQMPSYPPRLDDMVLRELSLQAINLGHWVLLQRDTADLVLNDEPYIGIQLLVEMQTKRYILRIWGKTKVFGRRNTAGYAQNPTRPSKYDVIHR